MPAGLGAMLASALLAAAPGPSPQAGAPLGASASFVLRAGDASGADTVSGTLRFVQTGDVCIEVTAPLRQQMLLSPRELVIYYPDRDLAFVASVRAGQAPPMLDAIAAGVADPGTTLPPRSRVVETRRAGGMLLTRWRIVDGDGRDLGEMKATEARDGTTAIELVDPAGKPQRRFSFADRVTIGGRSIPRAVHAEYFAPSGKRTREEHWQLSNVAAAVGAPAACTQRGPKTRVQALEW